jgi:Fe2+ transport system protein FeoA
MTSPAAAVLSALAIGQRGRVVGFDLPPDQRQRLLEMGLTSGVEFQIVRFAPLGDPIELKVRGYHLSLRRNEASGVRVECLSDPSK